MNESQGGASKRDHKAVLLQLGAHLKSDPRSMWRVLENGPSEWWPGLDSHDTRYLRFMDETTTMLSDELPAEVDDDSYAAANGIPSDFHSARALPGHQMPFPYSLTDNSSLRDELDLPVDFVKPRHRDLFDALHQAMFGVAISDASARFNPVASLALPTFKTGKVFKSALLDRVVGDFDGYITDLAKPSVEAWASRLAFPLTQTVGRLQNDAWKQGRVKDRYLPSYSYAMSGGKRGTRSIADRTVYIDGMAQAGFASKRARVAYAPSGVANMVGTLVGSQTRAGYFAQWPFTFHHTTADQIAAKLEGWAQVFSFDATQYDTTFPRKLVEYMLECDGRLFSPEYVALKRHVWFSHVWQAPTVPGDRDSWLCSWTDEHTAFDHTTFVGLPSGAWFNPDMGKFFMTWDLLCTFDNVLGDVLENLPRILQGKDPRFCILNASDDVRLGISDDPRLVAATAQWKSGKQRPTTYFAAEYGKGSFLGQVFYKEGGVTKTAPSLVSFFGNFFSPERPLNHPARKHWPLGWLERKKYYAAAPGARDAFTIVDSQWAKHFPGCGTLDGVAESEYLKMLTASKALEIARTSAQLTALDYEVLQDPSKLYWRVSEDDIHPDVLETLTLRVAPEDVARITKRHYRGQYATKAEFAIH